MMDYLDLEYQATSVTDNQFVSEKISQNCLNSVSKHFRIPDFILEAFLKTEGAYEGHIRSNSNGTYDTGPMQVNSIHWPIFYEKFNVSPIDIRYNGCINLMVGAKILRDKIDEHKNVGDWGEFFSILANYHSKTKVHNENYQEKLVKNLNAVLTSRNGDSSK